MSDAWLTGAMVVQTCGAHQGARVTSTCVEASGDLQMVGEERDEDELVALARQHHMCRMRSMQGLVRAVLEDSRCGSHDRIPSSALAPPLQDWVDAGISPCPCCMTLHPFVVCPGGGTRVI